MKKFMQKSFNWVGAKWAILKQEEGQGLVEYGLIIALVAIVLAASLVALNGGLTNTFTNIVGHLNSHS